MKISINCVTHSLWRSPFRDVPSNTASISEIKASLQDLKEDTNEILLKYPATFTKREAARILTHRNQLDIEMIVQSWRENKDIYGIEEAYSFNGRYQHRRSSSRAF